MQVNIILAFFRIGQAYKTDIQYKLSLHPFGKWASDLRHAAAT